MRRKSYLNVILTVNAVLLAGLLWVQLAGQPMLASEATAQIRTKPSTVVVPNAASQRQKIVDELRKVGQSVEALNKRLDSGKIKVEVTNIDQIGK